MLLQTPSLHIFAFPLQASVQCAGAQSRSSIKKLPTWACACIGIPIYGRAVSRRKVKISGLLACSRMLAVSRGASVGDKNQPEQQGSAYMRQDPDGEPLLLSAVVLASALLMAFWILVSPGSAWVGFSLENDRLGVEDWTASGADIIAPASLIFKYNVMGQAAGLIHALPGVVWALLAPVQLNPKARSTFGGGLHRLAGRLMLGAACVLMLGFALIDEQNISAQEIDFLCNGGALAGVVDDINATFLGGTLPPLNVLLLRILSVWFVYTGVQTWLTATVKPRNVREHRQWALRHIAAGLWVAAQRVFFIVLRLAQVSILGETAGRSAEPMGAAFYYAGYLAVALYMISAEIASDAE